MMIDLTVASQSNSPERDIFQVIERLYRFDDCLGPLDLTDYHLVAKRVLRVLGKPDAAIDRQTRPSDTPGSSPTSATGRGRQSQLYAAHVSAKTASGGAVGTTAPTQPAGGPGDKVPSTLNNSANPMDETAPGDQSMPQAGMLCLGCHPRNGLSSHSKNGAAPRLPAVNEGLSSNATDCARRIAESAYVNELVLNKQLLGTVCRSSHNVYSTCCHYFCLDETIETERELQHRVLFHFYDSHATPAKRAGYKRRRPVYVRDESTPSFVRPTSQASCSHS